jgi:hypothetical protein
MSTSRFAEWLAYNLATQGYCLDAAERRRLWLGLRLSTGLCLPLVVSALVLESPLSLVALAGIGALAGFTPRHPFDLVWNYGVRHLFAAPLLPPNPVRRRHAFKIGAGWLLAVAGLFLAGLFTARSWSAACLLSPASWRRWPTSACPHSCSRCWSDAALRPSESDRDGGRRWRRGRC